MTDDDGSRFGFEEADHDDAAVADPVAQEPEPDGITGQDPQGLVQVTVTEDADVLGVRLTAEWRSTVHPRDLHGTVLAAMNAATMQALARATERQQATRPDDEPEAAEPPAAADGPPITPADAFRLMDAVSAELTEYQQQAAAVTGQVVEAESDGHHVRVAGHRRQVTEVTIDDQWAGTARDTEIESELRGALSSFTAKSSLGDLAGGPGGSAIAELRALVRNPEEMVRRIAAARRS